LARGLEEVFEREGLEGGFLEEGFLGEALGVGLEYEPAGAHVSLPDCRGQGVIVGARGGKVKRMGRGG